MAATIAPGMLVRDDHGRIGIVAEPARRPAASWLREQIHPISEHDASGQWWAVQPLEGGSILSPENLLKPLRPATYDDFLAAVDGANETGRRSLASLFPSYVQRAMSSQSRVPK